MTNGILSVGFQSYLTHFFMSKDCDGIGITDSCDMRGVGSDDRANFGRRASDRREDRTETFEACAAAARLLNDGTARLRSTDTPLFRVVVQDIRRKININDETSWFLAVKEVERLAIPAREDFERAIKERDNALFNDLCIRLVKYCFGEGVEIGEHISTTIEGEIETREFLLDEETRSTVSFTIYPEGSFGVRAVIKGNFSPGGFERLHEWRQIQQVLT